MESPIEISYAGVVVGRVQEVRSTEDNGAAFFLSVREPLPVGTVVGLRSGGQETPARVVRVVEAIDAAGSGMQMRLIGDAEIAAPEWIPPPAKTKPVPPSPVIASRPEAVQESIVQGAESAGAGVTAEAETAPATPAETKVAAEPTAAIAEVEVVATNADPAPIGAVENAASETNAIPESVPVAVGSSMTGALENATDTRPYGQPTSTSDQIEAGTQSSGAATESGPSDGATTSTEELPPARPVAGPSGRRRTKRRK
jgi:hypothetical protein